MRRAVLWLAAVLACVSGSPALAATVIVNPGDAIQSLVAANPAGTTFLFNAGTYSLQSITPKTGNVFDGQGVAILDGMNTTKKAFQGSANNVTIKNLTVQNYRSDLQHAAIDAEFGNAWIIENNTIQANYSVGVNFGNNTQVLGNRLIDNGQAGFAGGGSGWLVENNEISGNNTRNLDWGFEAGGGKVTEVAGGTFRGNSVRGNGGPGIWLDIDANDILIENNVSWDNVGPGIMVEISRNVTVRNNVSVNNGVSITWSNASILISSSEDNYIYGNIVDVAPNRMGIFVMSQGREYEAINNEVYDNEIWLRGTQLGVQGVDLDDESDAFAANNFHDNTYHVRSLATRYFSWENDYNLGQAQARGKEVGSTASLLLTGDFNGDGTVDAADYTVWRNGLGSPIELAIRFAGDGRNGVDSPDFAIWKQNYGATAGAGGIAIASQMPVPEASTIGLTGIGYLLGSIAFPRRAARRILGRLH